MFQIINLASGIGGNVVSTHRTEAAAIAKKCQIEKRHPANPYYNVRLIIVAK